MRGKIVKIIGKSIWNKTIFVMCDCHAEFIQFTELNAKENNYDIFYYGNNCTAPEDYYNIGFTFTENTFHDFVDTLRSIILSPNNNISSIYYDKENTNYSGEIGAPKLEVFHKRDDWTTIRRSSKFEGRGEECIWEILLDEDSTKALLEELEGWIDEEAIINN